MAVIDEIRDLQASALKAAAQADRADRWAAGRYVESRARDLDNRYTIMMGLNEELRLELSAVVTIVFDYCLYDCLEDEDWMEALPNRYDGDLVAVRDALLREGTPVPRDYKEPEFIAS